MIPPRVYIPTANLAKAVKLGTGEWGVAFNGSVVTVGSTQPSAHVTAKHFNRLLRRLAKQNVLQVGIFLAKWNEFLAAAVDPTGLFNPVWTTLP